MRKKMSSAERRLAEAIVELVPRHRSNRRWIRSAAWRFCLTFLFVGAAFTYCFQWGWDLDHWPPGVPLAFVVAVAFTVRWAGVGAGWLAVAATLPMIIDHPVVDLRHVWMAVTLVLPLIVAKPGLRGASPHSPCLIRRISSSIRSITSSMSSIGLPLISRSTSTP